MGFTSKGFKSYKDFGMLNTAKMTDLIADDVGNPGKMMKKKKMMRSHHRMIREEYLA